jgi:acetyl/propionyl-CoA carboxylase alpha subunit
LNTIIVNNHRSISVEETGSHFEVNRQPFAAEIKSLGRNSFHVISENKSYAVHIEAINQSEKSAWIYVNGNKYSVQLKDRYADLLHELGMDVSQSKQVNHIIAPMPGLVVSVVVSEGQILKDGDAVVVLEAMKMENILKAAGDAVVKRIHVKKGEAVEKNVVLVELEKTNLN